MRLCPYCEYPDREGVLFFQNCGHELGERCDDTKAKRPSKQVLSALAAKTAAAPASISDHRTLCLQIQDAAQPFTFRSGGRLTLGRLGRDGADKPDLDLTLYGGLEKGVSRRHALIDNALGNAILIDLESRNGTYLNGQPITPHLPYILHTGDEIRLGSLAIHVYF